MIVGLTGGIGSGKTTVAKHFEAKGIPVYISDIEAKKLMHEDPELIKAIKTLLGDSSYENGQLNRDYIGKKIFNNKTLLKEMNAIVHPAVAKHFKLWVAQQDAPYVIKESAILFETGGYASCDYMITVASPIDLRIARLLKRDQTTPEKIQAKMSAQWSDSQRLKLTDFAIENINLSNIKPQVCKIHNHLIKKL